MAVEIWVVAEIIDQQVSDLSKEMIGFAKQAARDSRALLAVIVFGQLSQALADELSCFGAEKIYLQEHPALIDEHLALTLPLVHALAQRYQPRLIITGMTANGRDLAAGLSASLGLPYLPAACQVTWEAEDGLTVKTLLDDGLGQRSVAFTGPAILGITPDSRGIDSAGASREVAIIRQTIELPADGRVRQRESYLAGLAEIDLGEADVVVSGGSGMGDRSSFHMLHELGELIGAPVGGSRQALDKGWIPDERMIGATGKNLRAKIYLAFGISGAIQHLIGVKSCRWIIAVDKNPRAEIFQAADLAVVGDVREILPLLLQGLADYAPIKETGLKDDGREAAL